MIKYLAISRYTERSEWVEHAIGTRKKTEEKGKPADVWMKTCKYKREERDKKKTS